MTKFHFYILSSLICFVGLFSAPYELLFWLLFACIYNFILAMWWAWENRDIDVK